MAGERRELETKRTKIQTKQNTLKATQTVGVCCVRAVLLLVNIFVNMLSVRERECGVFGTPSCIE